MAPPLPSPLRAATCLLHTARSAPRGATSLLPPSHLVPGIVSPHLIATTCNVGAPSVFRRVWFNAYGVISALFWRAHMDSHAALLSAILSLSSSRRCWQRRTILRTRQRREARAEIFLQRGVRATNAKSACCRGTTRRSHTTLLACAHRAETSTATCTDYNLRCFFSPLCTCTHHCGRAATIPLCRI